MTDAITQNRQEYDQKVEEIRSNRDLSDEAKRRMMGEAYEEAAGRHGELVREGEEALAGEVAQAERSVFGLAYPKHAATESQRESVRQSYRDAAFRVLDVEPETLERVYDRAERVGDAQLAQAIYHEAVERGLHPLADRHRGTRPDAKRRWDRYVAARSAGESHGGMLASALSRWAGPEKPPELGRVG